MPETLEIRLEKLIEPPDPMRVEIDEEALEELARDIREHGLLQPLVVYPELIAGEATMSIVDGATEQRPPYPSGNYIVADGHRRYLACRIIKLAVVRCEVHTEQGFDVHSAMVRANLLRAATTPLEEGNIFCKWAFDEKLTEEQLKTRAGKPLSYIYERMQLVQGDPEISLAVHRKQIRLSCAKSLNKVTDESWRRYYLKLAIDQDAPGTQVAVWVRSWEIQQGLRPPENPDALQPTPTVIVSESPIRCILCGQNNNPSNLENVYICRNELNPILAALRAQANG